MNKLNRNKEIKCPICGKPENSIADVETHLFNFHKAILTWIDKQTGFIRYRNVGEITWKEGNIYE